MQVEFNLNKPKNIKEGDILIAGKNGAFDNVNKDELLKELYVELRLLKEELKNTKVSLVNYQKMLTKVVKGVINNG